MTTINKRIPIDLELVPLSERKGMPCAVLVQETNVEIWFHSPTGDSSDTHIFRMPCLSVEQAEVIAETYRLVFSL
jgi:hypothetical protein